MVITNTFPICFPKMFSQLVPSTPELLRHHANVFFFQIVNAGSFRQSAVHDAVRLLEKHNVHV